MKHITHNGVTYEVDGEPMETLPQGLKVTLIYIDGTTAVGERNADGDYLYKPGRACGTYAPPDVTIAAAVAKTEAADAQMTAIDFDALQVDDGVAYQPAAGVKGFSKWDPLYARLTKAGQSVELPRALRDRLFTECGKRNKKTGAKTWAISSTGPDTCRLWRLL